MSGAPIVETSRQSTLPEKTTVLVVDDDITTLGRLVDDLAVRGVEVSVATNAARGEELAKKLRPDLILLDLRLPDASGFEVCRRLKRHPGCRDVPVIFITVCGMADDKLEGFRCGAVDYIVKPLHTPETLARIWVHLRHRQQVLGLTQEIRDYEHRYGSLPEASQANADAPAAGDRRVLGARDLLDANYAEPFSLQRLAERVHLHPSTLSRRFTAEFGQSISDYLRERRLCEAARLLADTKLPIKAIAAAVGYRHGSDLALAFKRRYGVSPTGYRQARRQSVAAAQTDGDADS